MLRGGGGGPSFCRGQFFYFNPAWPLAENFKCLYRTVFEVNYLFHAESVRKYYFRNIPAE